MQKEKYASGALVLALCLGILASHTLLLKGVVSSWTGSALAFWLCAVSALVSLKSLSLYRSHPFAPTFENFAVLLTFFALGMACEFNAFLAPGATVSSIFVEALSGVGDRMEDIINDNFSRSDMVSALLLGRRGGLEASLIEAFRISGASHLLALSGLHLGIIYLFVDFLLPFKKVPFSAVRVLRSVILVVLCVLYSGVAGFGPSLQRALAFILAREVATSRGSHIDGMECLCTAAFVQLCFIDPNSLFAVGFQLSYLAVLGILLIYPSLSSWFPAGIMKRIWNACA
ncbi:MAG: ComEC/Rec2 family competence protein, partial [Bacteroidales bacterium]|nr:ComEC/Rec2 family competence protein [Bacteroidales bacterium]